jgi:hypothetical protein
MFHYRFCGTDVDCAIELPELTGVEPQIGSMLPTWICQPASIPIASWRRVHKWRETDGASWLRISRAGERYRLSFAAGVEFIVDGSRIDWSADADVPVETVRHLLIDQVLPLGLSARGAFVLHAAAVAASGGAIAFAGPSGRGKSTLAASYASCGGLILTDDCLRLKPEHGKWQVLASYGGVRLWPDAARALFPVAPLRRALVAHYTEKVRVTLPAPHDSIALQRLYLVEPTGAEPRVRPAAASAVVDVIRYVFRLDIHRANDLAEDFASAAQLVQHGLVRRLEVPRSLDALKAVHRAIAADLEAVV